MPRRKVSANSSGFTLIELLIAIAIIALLCGILFPAFASAKKSSFRSSCSGNLKQLYAAFLMYADDWNDTFPCPGGLYGDRSYWAQENGGLDKYLRCQHTGPKSVYCCPAYGGGWKSQWSPRTYTMNSFLRSPPDLPYPGSLAYLCGILCSDIAVPSNTILLFEGIPADRTDKVYGEGYVYRCADWTWVRGYYPKAIRYWQDAEKPWHGDRNNYLFCDGHVISMAPETYATFRGPTCPENNLWYASKLRDIL